MNNGPDRSISVDGTEFEMVSASVANPPLYDLSDPAICAAFEAGRLAAATAIGVTLEKIHQPNRMVVSTGAIEVGIDYSTSIAFGD